MQAGDILLGQSLRRDESCPALFERLLQCLPGGSRLLLFSVGACLRFLLRNDLLATLDGRLKALLLLGVGGYVEGLPRTYQVTKATGVERLPGGFGLGFQLVQ